jgi:putative transposase
LDVVPAKAGTHARLIALAKNLGPRLRALLSGINLREEEKSVAGCGHGILLPERQLETTTRNMYRISRFHGLINLLPRGAFDRAVAARQADKYRKGFSCWDQLLVMVYAQLSGAGSLRTVTAGFNAQASHHYHLDTGTVRRSTLADANSHTDPAVFADTARVLMEQVHRRVRQDTAELLYLLDSTSITLKGPGFDAWTQEQRTRNTQGVKLHVLYANGPQAPCQASLSAANVNDIEPARVLPLQAGVRYVFDKAYCDYAWWQAIDQAQACFVTRFKRNAALRVEQNRPISPLAQDVILTDQIVRFGWRSNRGGHTNPYQQPLRRITVARAGKDPLVLATNDLASPALDIARHYQARWGIELFFKWIKQHLGIKRFLGRTENAVKIQVLTALIAYLLLVLYRSLHATKLSLWECLSLLRPSLFQRPDVEAYRQANQHRKRQQALSLSRQALLPL